MMNRRLLLGTMIAGFTLGQVAHASFADVKRAFDTGQYFSSARMAHYDANHSDKKSEKAMFYAWTTHGLVKAGLDQSALYFFFKTIELQDRAALKKVLELAPRLMERTGSDLIRKFLANYTRVEDFTTEAKNIYYLALTKEHLLQKKYDEAIRNAALVQKRTPQYPVALQMKAAAEANLNRTDAALKDFEECASQADLVEDDSDDSSALQAKWNTLKLNAGRDLRARCHAGQARILYEQGKFEDADRIYDRIPKASFVWTDTLFEHAWATYAKEEYNRTLGKLVSYKSPSLSFTFNAEVDLLVAQSYFSLCLYQDSKNVIDDFLKNFDGVEKEVSRFLSSNPTDVRPYFALGKEVLASKLHTDRKLYRFMNRFVRAPSFQALALSQERIAAERVAIQRIDSARPETRTGITEGFPGFLNAVLDWRNSSVELLGGIYIKKSMQDYRDSLVSDLENMQFLKIDLLSHMKKKIMAPEEASSAERSRGNRIPVRRNDQLLWSFNGEFWNDEIGDYVFALESECGKEEQK
jgi:tetratricopeptide (TPR) repeat protein